jgi:DNA-binding response OmpR family regulator
MAWRDRKPRLLVVDDEEAILLAVRDYFSHRGFDVSCARDPVEAGRHLDGGAYDGVIADLRLSGSDSLEGLQIIERVRARSPVTRTIIVTAYGSLEAEREARRHGVDAFLHKPVPLAEIARVVTSLIEAPLSSES